MSSVTFPVSLGGDGSTVTDDGNASTGLANDGHRTRFVPALAQVVAIADGVLTNATAAASSASTASDHAATAANYANSAASSYDSFDDRYLGAKAADPTLDNDGNALLTGALYFNTVANAMKVYTGSAWDAAYVPGGSYLSTADIGVTVQGYDATTLKSTTIGVTVQAYDADTAKLDVAQSWTANQTLSDYQLIRAMFKDQGYAVVDKGNINNATVTFDYSAGSVQTYTATGSTVTWATSNWPPTGNLGELLIIGTNMGAYTHSISGITWIKPDGTTTTSIATYLAAITGRTAFQTSGIDQILLWSRDAGTTIYGKLI